MPAIKEFTKKEPVQLRKSLRRSFERKVDWWGCDHFSREMTILSDGSITTCCVDNMGANVFANIHDHDMNLEKTIDFLRPISAHLRLVRVYNYGEPFLHKKVDWFSRTLVDMCPQVKVGFSTNGTAFGNDARIERILDSGIHHIVVSLHGGREETVRKYMGSNFNFNKAVDNLTRFMAAKKRRNQKFPVVNLKTVLFKWNDSDEEMQSFRDLAERLGVDAWHMIPGGGPIGTTRFPPGSEAWNELQRSGLTQSGDQRNANILD